MRFYFKTNAICIFAAIKQKGIKQMSIFHDMMSSIINAMTSVGGLSKGLIIFTSEI
jgi:hypothetical protein